MRKRERRVKKQLTRIGTKRFGHGWAARQASKRHNIGSRLSARRIRKNAGKHK